MNKDEMMSIKPEPASGAMCREEQFGAMLVVGNMPILNLNEDAKRIWDLCDGIKTIAEIENTLGEDYEAAELRPRMLEFFHFCFQNGLLIKAGS